MGANGFDGVTVKKPKVAISLRVDPNVLEWFKRGGKGYQSRINAVLRSYMEYQKGKEVRSEKADK